MRNLIKIFRVMHNVNSMASIERSFVIKLKEFKKVLILQKRLVHFIFIFLAVRISLIHSMECSDIVRKDVISSLKLHHHYCQITADFTCNEQSKSFAPRNKRLFFARPFKLD